MTTAFPPATAPRRATRWSYAWTRRPIRTSCCSSSPENHSGGWRRLHDQRRRQLQHHPVTIDPAQPVDEPRQGELPAVFASQRRQGFPVTGLVLNDAPCSLLPIAQDTAAIHVACREAHSARGSQPAGVAGALGGDYVELATERAPPDKGHDRPAV